ncbi:MAG: chemotaxis-specific protein-glutamate methyltransferase CheB [Planctomycetes bacterium]|nr:chemotaxis-specific protein-glutamate methyltransferase CheB [Planctomycetota bacterium]
MPPIRALLVEDSATVRARLREVLEAAGGFEVVGEAGDGAAAVERCRALRPNLITMDMMLPVMSGLAAVEYLMAHLPTPILIVSSSTNRGELFKTYEALAAGAVDVLEKPRGDESDHAWEERFVAAARMVARIPVITHPRGRLATGIGGPGAVHADGAAGSAGGAAGSAGGAPETRVVAIGASTGGPGAVLEILRGLPADFRPPLLLVLHIGEPFGAAFADWLDAQTPRRVRYAREGEPLVEAAGAVVMAPPGRHLVARDGRLRLTQEPERHSCRPSIDVLFESLAREHGPACVACLLTGMGRDGAAGLLAVRRAGGVTIAQDEATSVVYGMPREAAEIGAAREVLPLPLIAGRIAALCRPRSPRPVSRAGEVS